MRMSGIRGHFDARRLKTNGYVFQAAWIGGLVYVVAYRLIAGHFPVHWVWGFLAIIGIGLIVEMFSVQSETLRNIVWIRQKIEELEGKVKEMR